MDKIMGVHHYLVKMDRLVKFGLKKYILTTFVTLYNLVTLQPCDSTACRNDFRIVSLPIDFYFFVNEGDRYVEKNW